MLSNRKEKKRKEKKRKEKKRKEKKRKEKKRKEKKRKEKRKEKKKEKRREEKRREEKRREEKRREEKRREEKRREEKRRKKRNKMNTNWPRLLPTIIGRVYQVPSFWWSMFWALARLSLPGRQDKNISSIFPHFPVVSLNFPRVFVIFFLILVFRMDSLPLRKGPGYATECVAQENTKLSMWVKFVRFGFGKRIMKLKVLKLCHMVRGAFSPIYFPVPKSPLQIITNMLN